MHTKAHWENVYSTKASDEVSWFQEHAALSLQLIRNADVPLSASIIDVGGGASTLVDDLLGEGYGQITVLDLSAAALAKAKSRLGERAAQVQWLEADVLEAQLPSTAYDVWHDRAVFHFLTTAEQRQAYVQAVLHAVKPGGLVIVATFAENGPEKCSGLPVMRYSADQLHAEFGDLFSCSAMNRNRTIRPAVLSKSSFIASVARLFNGAWRVNRRALIAAQIEQDQRAQLVEDSGQGEPRPIHHH